MNSPPLSRSDAISGDTMDLDRLIERLNEVEILLDRGEDLDLTGLDEEVRRVCQIAEARSERCAEPVIVRLQEVTDRLDRIAGLIENRLSNADSLRVQASAAYAVTVQGEE